MRKNKMICIGLLFTLCSAVMGVAVYDSQAAEEAGYAGANKCAMCHSNLAKGWQKTRHAKAFDTLKKKHQENLPGCVKCHVTGYEKDSGFVDEELTPELAGVQCEACHGPAADHASNFKNKDNLVVVPDEAVCRRCHTTGQDPEFDYANKKRFLHGEDQKGGK